MVLNLYRDEVQMLQALLSKEFFRINEEVHKDVNGHFYIDAQDNIEFAIELVYIYNKLNALVPVEGDE